METVAELLSEAIDSRIDETVIKPVDFMILDFQMPIINGA